MKKKKIAALAMAVVMTVSMLTGCGSSDKDTTNTAETGNTETTGAETAGTAESKSDGNEGTAAGNGEKTVINIWSKDRHDADYVQSKIDEYNATNTDNVEVVYTLYTDNYQQAIDMAVQNDELPDLMVFHGGAFNKYRLNDTWADLAPFMDDDMKEYFSKVTIEGYNEFDGKIYFLPTTGTTCRLFYNKEIFDRVGIAEPPKTLEEMVEDAKLITSELKGEGIYGFAQNMKSASSAMTRSMVIGLQRETGHPYGYNFKEGKYDFTDWADDLALWTELLSDECAFPGCESLDIDPLRTQFAAGNIGMYFSYIHAEPGVYANQFPMDSEKWGVAPIPTAGGKEVGKQYYDATSAYMFNAKSPNLEQAFKTYKDIFTNEDYLIGYYEGGYGVSILPQVVEKASPSKDFATKEWLQIHDETDALLPKPPHSIFTAGMVVEGEDMAKTAESIYYGGADIQSTLQDLTDRYNKAYEEAVANGTGYEVKIDNYDPMNPTMQ